MGLRRHVMSILYLHDIDTYQIYLKETVDAMPILALSNAMTEFSL
jgi:hypothetical protein